MGEGWEARAHEWLPWARTPGHDAYWSYRDAFFALLPRPHGGTLEVGCGEGRVARDLAARGHAVTAIDPSPTLVRAAAEADPGGSYAVAPAEALPFPDAGFALVVAHNALMDVQDMPAAVAEAARVLEPGGRLCACVTHPMADAGRWERNRLVITEPYLAGGAFGPLEEHRDGLTMHWEGRRHSLEQYARALEGAGLLLEALREPPPASPTGRYARWEQVPMFLMLRAVKPSGGGG